MYKFTWPVSYLLSSGLSHGVGIQNLFQFSGSHQVFFQYQFADGTVGFQCCFGYF